MKYRTSPIILLIYTIAVLSLHTSLNAEEQKPAFLNPPQYVLPYPDEGYSVDDRNFQGIPSIAQSPGGRLWATWYGGYGGGEDNTNYIIVATSGDDGKTWSDEALVIDADRGGPVRAFDPEIWLDPTGRLWVFWAQAIGHDGSISGVWAVTTDNPDDPNPNWSKARRLTDGIMMCKPTILSTGEWVLPVSTWRRTDYSARMVVSTDEGKTWHVRGAAHVPQEMRNFDEHMIVERKDGSLWMLVRLAVDTEAEGAGRQWPAYIGESVSYDRGETWTEVARGNIPHVRSRFYIDRLHSGNLILVKHADETNQRNMLAAYLSRDDGLSWEGGLIIEERSCSYPDGFQSSDGFIYVTYDRSRGSGGYIKMAKFTEADIEAGEIVSDGSKLKVLISRLTRYDGDRLTNQDGQEILQGKGARIKTGDGEINSLERGQPIFNDRNYLWHEVPGALKGKRFVQRSLRGGVIEVDADGILFVATPLPERNRNSASARLLEQGFEKVNHPEFLIFDGSGGSNNLCTLYQKTVSKGETIDIATWGVAIF